MSETEVTAADDSVLSAVDDLAGAPAAALDKLRPYGTVQGDLTKKYFQDGKYFDYAGKLLEE